MSKLKIHILEITCFFMHVICHLRQFIDTTFESQDGEITEKKWCVCFSARASAHTSYGFFACFPSRVIFVRRLVPILFKSQDNELSLRDVNLCPMFECELTSNMVYSRVFQVVLRCC